MSNYKHGPLAPCFSSTKCRCEGCCLAKSPTTIELKDAGNLAVNGVYTRTEEEYNGSFQYEKEGILNGSNAVLRISLQKSASGLAWFIFWRTLFNKDVDLYQTCDRVHFEVFPPRNGWHTSSQGQGIDPPPTLVYDAEFQLEWIVACTRPDNVVRNDSNKKCLSATLKACAFDSLIHEAALYWSYVCTMELWGDRDAISAALFQFIFSDPSHHKATRKAVVQLLHTGSRKEQCAILELAVWKFLCTMQCPTNLHGILDMSEWCRRGWKIRKAEVRQGRSNDLHVIITSVLPFLDSLVLPAGS
jgi:hypothetical protein